MATKQTDCFLLHSTLREALIGLKTLTQVSCILIAIHLNGRLKADSNEHLSAVPDRVRVMQLFLLASEREREKQTREGCLVVSCFQEDSTGLSLTTGRNSDPRTMLETRSLIN